ncbi:hypothetical protein [Actinocorallia libanotica]|uniref:Dolichyl-phosphate-mannose-protein mannosyltransferase n=1 Tax=Actinocorallia libanotica TaxID=46162 RepID=A0ABP4B320_9ACTN
MTPLSPVGHSPSRLRKHRLFAAVLAAGALLRVVAMAGYRPALWFNDSYDYVQIALDPFPHPVRPAGYGLFLWLLRPFHDFGVVVAAQHLLGLATGLLVYLLLTRRGLPPGWAALAASPVLLDGGIIQLESLVLSDTLFLFLVVAALTALLWPGRRHALFAVAGVLLAMATVTRTIGLPVLLLALAWLLLRRKWRAATLAAVAGLLPLAAYAGWFHAENGRYGITATDGVFLWGRTAAFVRCENIPEHLRYLCPAGEPETRKASSSQVWAAESPIGWDFGEAFDPRINADAQSFAVRALLEQPFDYARTVAYDLVVRTFRWERDDHPTAVTAGKYLFPEQADPLPVWPVLGGGNPLDVLTAYDPEVDPGTGTRTAEPYAGIMRFYQGVFTVRGPVLAAVLLLPACVWYRRRTLSSAVLPWTAGAALLAVPPLTVDFDYRYMLTATPVVALAAGYASARSRGVGLPVTSPLVPRSRPPS